MCARRTTVCVCLLKWNILCAWNTYPAGLLQPAEVDAGHAVEARIERPIEVAQPLDGGGIDVRMVAALRLAQAVRTGARLRLEQARKALGGVEVEVFLGDDALQAEKVLDGYCKTETYKHYNDADEWPFGLDLGQRL